MSLTTRVFIGLGAGFAVGLAIAGSASIFATALLAVAVPVGALFINLIRMTALPLVASLLVASVGTIGESRALGRTGARALALAVALNAIAAAGSALVAAPVLQRVQIDRPAAEALRGPTNTTVAVVSPGEKVPLASATQWFVNLVAPNVFKAAVEDAMLPVIVFAVLFGLAVARIDAERRAAVLRFVDGVAQAMQRLVTAILALAPFGVFALAVALASRLGAAAIAAVGGYIVLVVSLTVAAAAVLLYPLGIVGGRLSPAAFAAFCAPAQAMAFSSRSSVATLPAMLETASRAGLPPVVAGFIIPLGASMFRFGAAVAQTVGVLFLARLYGVELSHAQIASVVVTVIFTTFAVPGIPGGSIIAMVPVLASASLPVDGIGILLAVDTIPDMFRTTANATGTMALAAALRRSQPEVPLASSV